MKLPRHVVVRKSILHASYGRGRRWTHATFVGGVTTAVLCMRFAAGDTMQELASDCVLSLAQVEDAIRFELHPRRMRLAAVRKRIA